MQIGLQIVHIDHDLNVQLFMFIYSDEHKDWLSSSMAFSQLKGLLKFLLTWSIDFSTQKNSYGVGLFFIPSKK